MKNIYGGKYAQTAKDQPAFNATQEALLQDSCPHRKEDRDIHGTEFWCLACGKVWLDDREPSSEDLYPDSNK